MPYVRCQGFVIATTGPLVRIHVMLEVCLEEHVPPTLLARAHARKHGTSLARQSKKVLKYILFVIFTLSTVLVFSLLLFSIL